MEREHKFICHKCHETFKEENTFKVMHQRALDVIKQQHEKRIRPCGEPITAVFASLGFQSGHANLGIFTFRLINFEINI